MQIHGLRGRWASRSLVILLVVCGLAAVAPAAWAGATIVPPSATVGGKNYGDWSASWWKWALSVPAATNPTLDTTGANCAQSQSGQVWFLAGSQGTTETRSCTVPGGKYLFFPVLTIIYICFHPSDPDPVCSSVSSMRAAIASFVDNPRKLNASIDGVPVSNLASYRAQSPTFSAQLPAGALFGLPQTAFQPIVSDGYWLMLEPLSPGSHTLQFQGKPSPGSNRFDVDVTYNLTVTP
jgi:hypothetical protein